MSELKSVSFYLTRSHPDFHLAYKQLTLAKELRNAVLYVTRQAYFLQKCTRNDAAKVEETYGIGKESLSVLKLSDKFLLGKLARLIVEQLGMDRIPLAVAEQIGHSVAKNWKSYYGLMKAYKEKQVPVLPSIPGYSKRYAVMPIHRNSLNQKKLDFLSEVGMSSWSTRFDLPEQYGFVQAARLEAVNSSRIKFTVMYRPQTTKSTYEGEYVAGLDFGLENLFTVVLTDGTPCFTVSGRPLKSINHRYNNLVASLKSKYSAEIEGVKKKGGEIPRFVDTNRMRSLSDKRRRRLEAYYHSATNEVVRELQRAKVGTLVIGYNTGMKTSSRMSKNSNHKFIPIPHKRILDELSVKCEENNIKVLWTEESYTSKSSFVDNDPLPTYGNKSDDVVFSGVRVSRSMYRTADGRYIPADVNAAFNIIKKIAPASSFEDVGDGVGIPQVRRLRVASK